MEETILGRNSCVTKQEFEENPQWNNVGYEKKKKLTFSEYIISERSEFFYFTSLEHMIKCKVTLEEWFKDMYYEWNILYNE